MGLQAVYEYRLWLTPFRDMRGQSRSISFRAGVAVLTTVLAHAKYVCQKVMRYLKTGEKRQSKRSICEKTCSSRARPIRERQGGVLPPPSTSTGP